MDLYLIQSGLFFQMICAATETSRKQTPRLDDLDSVFQFETLIESQI